MASAKGIDVSELEGSGPRGRVTKPSGGRAVERRSPAAPAKPRPRATRRTPIRGPAATLVRFMDESRSIPTATSFRTLGSTPSGSAAPLKDGAQALLHTSRWAIVRRPRLP